MSIAPSWYIGPAIIAAVLATLLAVLRTRHVRHAYDAHFQESRHERLFLAWIGFAVTVAVVRSLTWAIHNGIGPFHDISMGGRHIHHLVWGIFNLRDVYWDREGRASFEALALFGGLLGIAVFGAGFFRRLLTRRGPRESR